MTAFDGDWKSPCGCEAHLRGLEEVGFGLGGGRAEEAGVRRDGDWKSPCGCEAHLRGLRGWVLGWRGRGGTALKRNLRVAMIEPEKVKALFSLV